MPSMKRTYLKKANPRVKPVAGSATDVPGIVRNVIDSIRKEGDAAVRRHSNTFDRWSPQSFKLSEAEIEHIMSQVPEQIINDIKTVQANVRKFATAQKESIRDFELEMTPGVFLGQKNNPIDSVGA